MNQTLRILLIAVLAGLKVASAIAAPFDAIYVFGDSLSDNGNDLIITTNPPAGVAPVPVPASPPYYQGRFSNGPIYADVLARGLGLPLTPSVAGGNNYAYGGARSDYVRPNLIPFGALSLVSQINSYLASTPVADPKALYVLWEGSNDMFDVLTRRNPTYNASIASGNTVQVATQDAINHTLNDIDHSITGLASIGAQHFLIPNLPNLGLVPDALKFGLSANATSLAQDFNAALDAMLNKFISLDLFRYDAFFAHTTIFNNQADYGLTNVTQACYTGVEEGTPGATICATPDSYLSWDHEHPSAVFHSILGTQMVLLVPEPSDWALFITGLVPLIWQVRVRQRVSVQTRKGAFRRASIAVRRIAPVVLTYPSTIDYLYDAANRLTRSQDSANGTFTRAYDDRFDSLKQEATPLGTVGITPTMPMAGGKA